MSMAEWAFLTNHARVLLHVAYDPGARLRDIAASLGITERRAHGIITDLAEAGRTGGRLAPDRRRQRRCTAWAALGHAVPPGYSVVLPAWPLAEAGKAC